MIRLRFGMYLKIWLKHKRSCFNRDNFPQLKDASNNTLLHNNNNDIEDEALRTNTDNLFNKIICLTS